MWQSVLQGCPSTAGVTTRIEEHVTWKVGFEDLISTACSARPPHDTPPQSAKLGTNCQVGQVQWHLELYHTSDLLLIRRGAMAMAAGCRGYKLAGT